MFSLNFVCLYTTNTMVQCAKEITLLHLHGACGSFLLLQETAVKFSHLNIAVENKSGYLHSIT